MGPLKIKLSITDISTVQKHIAPTNTHTHEHLHTRMSMCIEPYIKQIYIQINSRTYPHKYKSKQCTMSCLHNIKSTPPRCTHIHEYTQAQNPHTHQQAPKKPMPEKTKIFHK